MSKEKLDVFLESIESDEEIQEDELQYRNSVREAVAAELLSMIMSQNFSLGNVLAMLEEMLSTDMNDKRYVKVIKDRLNKDKESTGFIDNHIGRLENGKKDVVIRLLQKRQEEN